MVTAAEPVERAPSARTFAKEAPATRAFHSLLHDRWISPEKLFVTIDRDGSETLTMAELFICLEDLGYGAFIAQHGVELFKEMDVNQDGSITVDEFIFALQAVNGVYLEDMSVANLAPIPPPVINDRTKYIALVAHNNMKAAMVTFVSKHREYFGRHALVTTGSTGQTLEKSLKITVAHKVSSGPLGGDQEIGAMIAQSKIAAVFFFRDPMASHVHHSDIEALLRLCDTHQVPSATNLNTARALVFALQQNGIAWFGTSVLVNPVVDTYVSQQKTVIKNVVSDATAH